tara:strand:+ start:1514 stop:2107 length:594 start_codon:yes stop_codon:yes gene_type:complete
VNYKKYQEGGQTTAPVMTQSLANVLLKIQGNQDKKKILDAEKEIEAKLEEEIIKAEQVAREQDLYSAIGKLIGGYGGAGLATMSPKTKRFAPIAGAVGDVFGSFAGKELAGDYKAPDVSDLDIEIPQTMFYSDEARMLAETGESGLQDIEDRSGKSEKDLRDKILLSAVSSLPVYGESISGDDWLSTLFGRDTEVES